VWGDLFPTFFLKLVGQETGSATNGIT
jgi:hypothetical protein